MSLLKKLIEQQAQYNAKERETHYGKLISYSGARDVIVEGVAKAMLNVQLIIDGTTLSRYVFKDSVFGLPNFVPAGGIECVATFVENERDGKKYVNLVSLGIKA